MMGQKQSPSMAVARVEAAMWRCNTRGQLADEPLEHGRVKWVPPGWGLAYWDKGLWLMGDDGEWTKSGDLGTQGISTLASLLPAFCRWVTGKTGVSLPDEEAVR